MKYVSATDDKISLIQQHFVGLVGKTLIEYEVPQHWDEDSNMWANFMDYPLILNFGENSIETSVSVSWRLAEDLAIESDRVLPFNSFFALRWICEGIDVLDKATGRVLRNVHLASDCSPPFGNKKGSWTHLLLKFEDESVLDIFSAADETGFSFEPNGITSLSVPCVPVPPLN